MKISWPRRRRQLRHFLAGRALLGALSLAYGLMVSARRRLYELKILRSVRLPAKVICIGNLTTGGTGKTPAVLLAAQILRQHRKAVAILTRGYARAEKSGDVLTLLDGQEASWTECGDEPWMMHQALQGQDVPILVSPDRVKAGRQALRAHHSGTLILDDGFQHFRLKRNLDVVLINARDPFGGGRLLPSGNLREPVSALARAHIVMLTHADLVDEKTLEAIKRGIEAANPKVRIIEAAHKSDFLLDARAAARLPLDRLRGKPAIALCGLGDPESFERQLTDIGVALDQKWRYPDHHPYTLAELRSIDKVGKGLPVVTTSKDFVRFPKGWQSALKSEILVLAVKLEILKGGDLWTRSLLNAAVSA